MTVAILRLCPGCEGAPGVHRREFEGRVDFYCDACADDEIGIVEPGVPYDPNHPANRYDRARDRWEEDSLAEDAGAGGMK